MIKDLLGIKLLRNSNLISFLAVIFLLCNSCISDNKSTDTVTNDLNSLMLKNQNIVSQTDSLISNYLDILDGLKCEYVLFEKQSYNSIDQFDSMKFKEDSIKYFVSYSKFFNQDYRFIDWLLTFKGDTSKTGLWQKYLDPISSYIGECHCPMTNERAAINLIENYLFGDNIICHECGYSSNDCNERKYELIEDFISRNRDKSVEELRVAWKKLTHTNTFYSQ